MTFFMWVIVINIIFPLAALCYWSFSDDDQEDHYHF